MSQGMKVLALRAENFKRLRVVELEPDDNFVEPPGAKTAEADGEPEAVEA